MTGLIVDSFAGGGGASLGIKWALGRGPDVAINHSPAAIKMHAANHPKTIHYTEDVFKAAPHRVTGGLPVELLWASPDCTHHSRAKGGKPVKKQVRGLAWVVVKWAVEAKPRVIILENVREFEDWGPIVPQWVCKSCEWKGTEGQARLARTKRRCPRCDSNKLNETSDLIPDPTRKGLTFKQFTGRLRNLGYAVGWKVLNAADFGAPTHRRRLFLVARNDGEPITWPDPMHGDPKKIGKDLFSGDLKPWRKAAECIDWSIPCPSIFLAKEEGRAVGVKRPLADKTLRRIALGIKRYVLDNPKPFIVANTSGNPPTGADEPLKTVTTGNHHYLVTPTVMKFRGDPASSSQSVEAPLPTVTAGSFHKRPAGAGHALGLASPILVPLTHAGERRSNSPEEPFPTVTGANRGEFSVVSPVLAHLAHGEGKGGRWGHGSSPVEQPIGVVHAGGKNYALVAPTLVQTGYSERDGQQPRALDIEAPLGTVVAGGGKHALVSAFIAKHFGGVVGHVPERPLGTITAIDHHSVVAANLIHLNHGEKTCSGVEEPARAVTAQGNHAALVYSFLTKYHGNGGQWSTPNAPAPTVDCKDRIGLVTVTIDGQDYAIVDIGMRMLRPRELARAQGFPDDYILTGTLSQQVERIGNSVSPYAAKAVVLSNLPDLVERPRPTRRRPKMAVTARTPSF